VKVVRAALLGCVSLPAGKPFSACATKLVRESKFGNQAETRRVKKRLPHFMMLTIVSMIVSSPALLPQAALSGSNSDEQAVENTCNGVCSGLEDLGHSGATELDFP